MRLIRTIRPDVVYVNTVTIPIWVVAARLARRPVLVHVREAEEDWPRAVRVGLSAPLLLASSIVANSAASKRVLIDSVPSLAAKTLVIYNGMPGPRPTESSGAPPRVPGRLALVARLSPRKGVDVALEAVALLRQQGRAVTLDVCGSVYPGYEWFEEQLRERASQDDLAGAVPFAGYVNPTWPVLATASVVLVPSRVEPFGNAAVEGLLAARPVVASDVQELAEIIEDGRTGLLVPAGDADALAATIGRLLDDEDFALRLAVQGRVEAHERFAVDRHHREIIDAVAAINSKPAVPQDVMSAG